MARLTIKNKKYEKFWDEMQSITGEADRLRGELLQAVEDDSKAFEDVMAAFRMPKSSDEEKQARKEHIQAATLNAALVPLSVVSKSLEVLRLAVQVAEGGNSNAITDSGTAFVNALSSITGAAMNVRINLGSLKDEGKVNSIKEELHTYEEEVKELQNQMMKAVKEKGNIPYSRI